MPKSAQPQDSSNKIQSNSVPAADNKKRAAAFEIDDIFGAKKSKPAKAVASAAQTVSSIQRDTFKTNGSAEKIGKKSKKGKQSESEQLAQAQAMGDAKLNKKRVPETVVDTSASITAYQPPPPPTSKRNADGNDKSQQEEDRFMDSRGTRQSTNISAPILNLTRFLATGARTDDGLAIYTVEELNIGRGGGEVTSHLRRFTPLLIDYNPVDTPECPFDCTCCF